MASKKTTVAAPQLTAFEKPAGLVLLLLYAAILPLFGPQCAAFLGNLMGISLSMTLFSTICFYVLFAAALIVFHSLLAQTSAVFVNGMDRNFKAFFLAFFGLYGVNEIVYRLSFLLWGNQVNINDGALLGSVAAPPVLTALAAVLLVPAIEELLFRGLLFGWLRPHSRVAAYLISALAFAAFHAWQFGQFHADFYQLLLVAQYLVPGLLLTWSYERGGSLWTPIGVHAAFNAMALWAALP